MLAGSFFLLHTSKTNGDSVALHFQAAAVARYDATEGVAFQALWQSLVYQVQHNTSMRYTP